MLLSERLINTYFWRRKAYLYCCPDLQAQNVAKFFNGRATHELLYFVGMTRFGTHSVASVSYTHQQLKSLMEKSFKEADVVGGGDNWYFSDEAGNELNADSKISELGLANGQVILLNQRAGAAG